MPWPRGFPWGVADGTPKFLVSRQLKKRWRSLNESIKLTSRTRGWPQGGFHQMPWILMGSEQRNDKELNQWARVKDIQCQ